MRLSRGLRAAAIALAVLAGAFAPGAARADSGTIRFAVLKGGWFVGASGGDGALFFHGKVYPVSVGGLSAGLVFGASRTSFHGTVSNIREPADVTGAYFAVGGGAAVIAGRQVIVLQNEKGAQLRLTGEQIGLQVNIDLSGLAIRVKWGGEAKPTGFRSRRNRLERNQIGSARRGPSYVCLMGSAFALLNRL